MRFISADIIYPVTRPSIRNGILVVDNAGIILKVIDPITDDIDHIEEIEKLDGALCPGFVNAHCHLELSHLKGKLTKNKSLPGFIGEIVKNRNAGIEEIKNAMLAADREMFNSGIVAIGDISNNNSSIQIKSESEIHYHTFVEIFDLSEENADSVFLKGTLLSDEYIKSGLPASIVPHSPYTVSEKLLKMIAEFISDHDEIACIHNQETKSEDEMFLSGKGILLEKLLATSGLFKSWKATNKSSLNSTIVHFPPDATLQLVHNTYSKKADIEKAVQSHKNLFWCLCVNANLFIEDSLPDIPMLMQSGCRITIGTDSYASNDSLSVWEELKTISKYYPEISLEELISWSTINGASFLGIDDKYGSFSDGKSPGIVHISNMDVKSHKISAKSTIRRVV